MKFGIICSTHWPEGQSQAGVYDEIIGHMVEAERLGFWSAWTTEHHFAADPEYRPFGLEGPFPAYDLTADPLTFLSNVAARTSRIRLGTGVLVVHYDDPIRVAERAAMVDLLSGGRLELGLGRGGGVHEPRAFHVPSAAEDNQDKYFEAIDVMRKAWSGRRFSHEGKYFQVPPIQIVPQAAQARLPVFLSNRNPRSIAYAAEHGMSYVAVTGSWGTAGIEGHNQSHKLFQDVAAQHGRDLSGVDYPQTLFTYIAPSDAEAEDVAEEHLLRFRAFAESHYEARRTHGESAPMLAPGQTGPDAFRDAFKAQLETNLIGSPATVREKLAALREKMPSMNYVLSITGAGSPPAGFTRRSMTLLARDVIPHFADAQAVPA